LVQAVVCINEEAELFLDKLRFTRKVLDVAAENLRQAEVLVEGRSRLTLALEDVAEAGTQANFASPIED